MEPTQISFDPGSRACGYCVWREGKLFDYGTIYPKGDDFGSRLYDLFVKLRRLIALFPATNLVAVEEFGKHSNKRRAAAMLKCSQAQSIVKAVAWSIGATVIDINKGKESKTTAQEYSKSLGVKGSKDCHDAVYFGSLAGFDNKEKK